MRGCYGRPRVKIYLILPEREAARGEVNCFQKGKRNAAGFAELSILGHNRRNSMTWRQFKKNAAAEKLPNLRGF